MARFRRIAAPVRDNWQQRLEKGCGLTYWPTEVGRTADGQPITKSYWGEGTCYEVHEHHMDLLESAAQQVLAALVDAGNYAFANPKYLDWMVIPKKFRQAIYESWEANPPSVFGRFDVCWDGTGNPKFYEYNATPTSLLEMAAQWQWLTDLYGPGCLIPNTGFSQWNLTYEKLLAMWQHLRAYFIKRYGELPMLYYSCTQWDDSNEDRMNVEYMADIAREAGWKTEFIFVDHIRYVEGEYHPTSAPRSGRFHAGYNPINAIFNLYPWEMMFVEENGDNWLANSLLDPKVATTWVEPPYKTFLGNKGLWALAWERSGNDSVVGKYLLPTFFERDQKGCRQLTDYASKPILAREGSGIRLVIDGKVIERIDGRYDRVPRIWQQYQPLPNFDGHHPVLGVWMIGSPEGDVPAGMGIRESDGLITGNGSIFVPHRVVMRHASGLEVPTR